MDLSERDLVVLARRRYELGRVLAGLVAALLVLPMALASLAGCDRPVATLACAAALSLLIAASVWYGREAGRAVGPGLWAGLPPLMLPLLLGAAQRVCAPGLCLLFPAACVAGGLAGGVLLGWRAARRGEASVAFWTAASLIATLAGSLGCLMAGASGLIGMTLGFSAGALPTIAAARRS